jgi:hypothetical protein
VSNATITDDWWIGKDSEGCLLTEVPFLHLPGRTEKPTKTSVRITDVRKSHRISEDILVHPRNWKPLPQCSSNGRIYALYIKYTGWLIYRLIRNKLIRSRYFAQCQTLVKKGKKHRVSEQGGGEFLTTAVLKMDVLSRTDVFLNVSLLNSYLVSSFISELT